MRSRPSASVAGRGSRRCWRQRNERPCFREEGLRHRRRHDGCGHRAQVANAGIPVLLLDIVRDPDDRNAVAAGAVAKMLKTDPAPFMSKAAAKLVETGNIEDDLAKIADCDWIIEAIVERLDLKHGLYEKIEAHRRPDAAVSSNTSTIPLGQLIEGRSEGFRSHFLITHFFNPPRYMRLLEIVTGAESDTALVERIADFADRTLGKSVVRAKDTPGFIAIASAPSGFRRRSTQPSTWESRSNRLMRSRESPWGFP
jgi:3-hydroxyacyl-CoA dehydrogenase